MTLVYLSYLWCAYWQSVTFHGYSTLDKLVSGHCLNGVFSLFREIYSSGLFLLFFITEWVLQCVTDCYRSVERHFNRNDFAGKLGTGFDL